MNVKILNYFLVIGYIVKFIVFIASLVKLNYLASNPPTQTSSLG